MGKNKRPRCITSENVTLNKEDSILAHLYKKKIITYAEKISHETKIMSRIYSHTSAATVNYDSILAAETSNNLYILMANMLNNENISLSTIANIIVLTVLKMVVEVGKHTTSRVDDFFEGFAAQILENKEELREQIALMMNENKSHPVTTTPS